MTQCLFFVDKPQVGAWNMAMDEFCALCAEKENLPILRLCRWETPFLSLGYFQRYQDYEEHSLSGMFPVVRRPSGGGAILHYREWTYSISLPSGYLPSGDRLWLYRTAHQTLATWIESLGLEPEIIAESPPPCAKNKESCPFLCFERRAVGDVVVCAASDSDFNRHCGKGTTSKPKVVGSAQRRYRNAILQHGSVLMAQTPLGPELPGILELLADAGIKVKYPELLDSFLSRWPTILAQTLGWELIPWIPPVGETSEFAQLCAKFVSREWTHKSSS